MKNIQDIEAPQFVSTSSLFEKGGLLEPKDEWDKLSMAAKAEMMRVAVNHGIYDLQTIRQKYNEFAEGGKKDDEQYYYTMEKVAEDNYKDWGFSNSDEALIHALNDNTFNYRDFYRKYPWSEANATTHWTDEFKTVWHPTFSNESTYSGQKSQYNPQGLTGGFWVDDSFFPSIWQLDNNEYSKGGGIHIKPSHRGRLTELKKRTGKTEAELYSDGNPAHKRMVVFARNARRWKHGDGGPLVENVFLPGGTITYSEPFYSYDTNGNLILDENGKPTINYNGKLSEVVITPSREPIGLDYLVKGVNQNSNQTVGDYAKEAGEAAVRQRNRKVAEAVERFNSQNEMHTIFPTSEVSGETVYDYKQEPKVIGLSGTDPLAEFYVAGEALGPLFRVVPPIYNKGVRFVQNVSDRHQGMMDAAEYAASNFIKSKNAMDVTNYIWKNRHGPQASKIIAPYKDEAAFMKKSDGSATAVATNGGHQTINMHLGGVHYGDKPWELDPMDKTGRFWLREYTETAPQGTIFGEVGTTKNFAEQYNEVTPSWTRAIKDAITNKKEVNNPYWKDYEENTLARMAGASGDEDLLSYYTHQLNNNNPLSVDSYSMIFNMARRGKYDLRYDSSPMGLFNNVGVREKEFYNSLSGLSSKEKVDAINKWITKFNPEARPAYLEDGEVIIPRPLLKKITPSRNTWLK